jgi:hypothetical protein
LFIHRTLCRTLYKYNAQGGWGVDENIEICNKVGGCFLLKGSDSSLALGGRSKGNSGMSFLCQSFFKRWVQLFTFPCETFMLFFQNRLNFLLFCFV